MAKEDVLKFTGTVEEVLGNSMFRVKLENGHQVPAYIGGKMRMHTIKIIMGDIVEVKMTCNNILDTGERCGNVFEADMDVGKVETYQEVKVSDTIKLDTHRGVKMKYPSYSALRRMEKNEIDQKTNLIIKSIEHIYDKDGVYPAKDYTPEELKEFVEGLTEKNYKQLEAFVDNSPTFIVNLEATCPKCKFEHKVRYTDFYDFFT